MSTIREYGGLLFRYVRPQGTRAALLVVLLLGHVGLQLVGPHILKYFIDAAAAGEALQPMLTAAGLYLALALVTQGVAVAEAYVAENVGLTATNRLRADLTLHCLGLDLGFHHAHSPGALIERVDGDVATLSNFFSRFVIHIVGSLLLLTGAIVLLVRVDWRVGVAMGVFAVAAPLAPLWLRRRAANRWVVARQASADLFGFLEERLAGTEDIRANGGTGYVIDRLRDRSAALLRHHRGAALWSVAAGGVTLSFTTLTTAAGLVVAAALYRDGAITIGTVFLLFSLSELLARPIEQFSRQLQDLQQASASIGRILDLFSARSEIPQGTESLPAGPLGVEFEDVSFEYTAEERVLRHVSFKLPPGKVLGLLGRTGSGKTSLIRLLFRLYGVSGGRIRLGGVDLRDARESDIRERVAMVTQDIQLFHATVRDNLTFFDRSIEDERILEAIRDLGLGEWYAGLARGLDTKLAPGGSGLSAGEAQLLAFVRVFLKDPGLVILDEASSRLDPLTEHRIERATERLLTGRTGIIIAHRLRTLDRADLVMVLDQGTVREFGPRERLAADVGSRYYELLNSVLEEAVA